MQRLANALGLLLPSEQMAFHLVEDQPIHKGVDGRVQGHAGAGGWIEHHLKPRFMALFQAVGQAAGFVLEQGEFSRPGLGQGLVDEIRGQAAVGPRVDDDAILAGMAVHLDDGMAGGGIRLHPHVGNIRPRVPQQLGQHGPVRADLAGMVDLCAGPGQGDGLIQPLAPCKYLAAQGSHGLAPLDEMIHGVYIIQIQRTKGVDRHNDFLSHFFIGVNLLILIIRHLYCSMYPGQLQGDRRRNPAKGKIAQNLV